MCSTDLAGLKTATATIVAALMVFRAEAVTMMVHLIPFSISVSGGVLRSTIKALHGYAIYILELTICQETASVRIEAFLCAASGIPNSIGNNSLDSLYHLPRSIL